LKLQWWNWDIEKITENVQNLTDLDLEKLEKMSEKALLFINGTPPKNLPKQKVMTLLLVLMVLFII
jgi:hypothetical protein